MMNINANRVAIARVIPAVSLPSDLSGEPPRTAHDWGAKFSYFEILTGFPVNEESAFTGANRRSLIAQSWRICA
jgi:hypothetical protein